MCHGCPGYWWCCLGWPSCVVGEGFLQVWPLHCSLTSCHCWSHFLHWESLHWTWRHRKTVRIQKFSHLISHLGWATGKLSTSNVCIDLSDELDLTCGKMLLSGCLDKDQLSIYRIFSAKHFSTETDCFMGSALQHSLSNLCTFKIRKYKTSCKVYFRQKRKLMSFAVLHFFKLCK